MMVGNGLQHHAKSAEKRQRIQTLFLIRHAEGMHNVAAGPKSPYPKPSDPEYELKLIKSSSKNLERNRIYESESYEDIPMRDAALSPDGELQCASLRKETDAISWDLVVVSPLLRTLQTATLGLHRERKTPWVALDCIRECSLANFHPCDARNSRDFYMDQMQFADIDWSEVPPGDDTHRNETEEELSERCQEFLSWVSERPEESIVVVSHSGFLRYLTKHFLPNTHGSGPNGGEGSYSFANAELKVVQFQSGSKALL